VIYLPGHTLTEEHLPTLQKSAKKHNWNVELFEGIDGRKVPFTHKIDHRYPKAVSELERPGVRGCFMSHYLLWKKCLELNETIGIFESDIIFYKSPPLLTKEYDLVKLDGFKRAKPASTGNWHKGAHAYILHPSGAKKMVDWTDTWGASPADFMLGNKVVNMKYDYDERVKLANLGSSLTRNLEEEMLNLQNKEI